MSNHKVNKLIYLLIGIIFGFFVGGGIIWWQINAGDGSMFGNQSGAGSGDDGNQGNYEQLSMKDMAGRDAPGGKKDQIGSADSVDMTLDEFVLRFGGEYPDSVLVAIYNSRFSGESVAGEDVVVMRDELIFVKDIEVQGIPSAGKNALNIDSLLTDDHQPAKKNHGVVRVEFWKSPINYKGYKMDGRKLVLFGIYEYDNVSLHWIDGSLYLRSGELCFYIPDSGDFSSLVPVKDAGILKKLQMR